MPPASLNCFAASSTPASIVRPVSGPIMPIFNALGFSAYEGRIKEKRNNTIRRVFLLFGGFKHCLLKLLSLIWYTDNKVFFKHEYILSTSPLGKYTSLFSVLFSGYELQPFTLFINYLNLQPWRGKAVNRQIPGRFICECLYLCIFYLIEEFCHLYRIRYSSLRFSNVPLAF